MVNPSGHPTQRTPKNQAIAIVLIQAWADYGPGAICDSLSFLIRSAELEEIILLDSKL